MKKTIYNMLLVAFLLVSCQENVRIGIDIPSGPLTKSEDTLFTRRDTVTINKEEALKIVEPFMDKYPDRWIDISNDFIPASTKIAFNALGHKREVDDLSYFTSPDFDAWLLVIEGDLSIMSPQILTHIFVNVDTGEYVEKEVKGRAIVEWDTSRYTFIDSDENVIPREIELDLTTDRSSNIAKYAVIISGGTDMYNNTSCFFNDTRRFYNYLIDSLGFSYQHIFVYMSDGSDPSNDQRTGTSTYTSSLTDLNCDGIGDTVEAKKARLNNGFSLLGLVAQPGDEVIVYMTDTGYYDGSFNLWDGEALYPTELNKLLNKLGPLVKKDIIMGQSYSGAFISTIAAPNRTISTSCSTYESAHRNTYLYTDFLKQWIDAIEPFADLETTDPFNDGYVSPLEVFNVANAWILSNYTEHPQYNSTPSDFGERHSLKGDPIPYLSGSNYLSVNSYLPFTLHNCPVPYLISWDVGSNAQVVSYADSTVYVRGKINSSSQYYASNTTVGAEIMINGEMHHFTKMIDSVWKPGQYMNYNLIQGGGGMYFIGYHQGEHDFYWESSDSNWQITNQNNNYVYVSEGYTLDPVYLMVSFYDPFGGSIYICDQVQ